MGRSEYAFDNGIEDVDDFDADADRSLRAYRTWRGDRVSTEERSGIQGAGSLTAGCLAGLRERSGLPMAAFKAMDLWRTMGDVRLRKHVVGLFLRQNRATRELVVSVDGSVWLTEFKMSAPSILVEWNHRCEEAGVDMTAQKISFKLSKTARRAGATGSVATYGSEAECLPVALSAEERAMVEKTVAVISDESVRAQAARAMTSVMEWKRGASRTRH